MKSLIAVLALVVSANSFAYSVVDVSLLTLASPFLSSASSSGGLKAQANQVLNDAQEYIQSEKASAFLSERIKLVQDSDDSISEMEAVEILVNEARTIASK